MFGRSKRLQVRGSTVDAARRYAERHKGTPEFEQFMNSLSATQRSLFDRPIKRSRWYDVETYSGMLDTAARCLAPDAQEEFLSDGGRFVVDDGISTLYRAFFRIASPSFVLRGSALFWRMFFRGSKLKIRASGRRFAHAQILGASYCGRALCVSIRGGMVSSLEHAGATDVKVVHHSCRCSGGDRCEYRFSWS